MYKKIILASGLIITLLALAGCSSTENGDLSLVSVQNSGDILPLEDTSYDWENIDIAGGNVSKTFSFKNDGDTDLVLKGASTSCMCTEATFKLPSGDDSPIFGMHANPQWAYAIKPGEEFSVDVVFDPMAHGPDAVGPISRTVYLLSSSLPSTNVKAVPNSNDVVTELRVSGNVLYTKEFEAQSTPEEPAASYQNISPEELNGMLSSKDFFLVDVHIPEQEHIEQTDAFIDYTMIEENIDQLPKNKNEKIVVYCRSGSMSMEASQKLIDLGYTNVYNLEGGRNAFIELET